MIRYISLDVTRPADPNRVGPVDSGSSFTLDRCVVQTQSSSAGIDDTLDLSQVWTVKVHVAVPVSPNVRIGDTFAYAGVNYVVTDVSAPIMSENVVRYVPLRWSFMAKKRGK